MKSFRYLILSALLLALGVSATGDALAQKGGRGRGGRLGDTTDVRRDSVLKDSIRHDRDSLFQKDRPGHRGNIHNLIGYYLHNDSCRGVLVALMSAEDAAAFTAAIENIRGNNAQLKELRTQLRAAREAGDTTAFRAISEQLKALYRMIGANHKTVATILNKYAAEARRVSVDCGGRKPKGPRDGGARDDRKEDGHKPSGVITPNPVQVGGTAVLNLNLAMEASVAVTISDQTGTVLTIPAAQLAAGEQQIALDVSALPRGAYLVQVQIGDRMQVLKLMIQ